MRDLCFIPYLSGHQLSCIDKNSDFVQEKMHIIIHGKDIFPQRSSTTIAYTTNKLHKQSDQH